jgi:fructoselysine-6-P-deglycase FrlB-like protein
VGKVLETYQARSQAWKGHFKPYQAFYYLGRGASQASALQAALLSYEMARFPGVFFSAGAFRHGPWEVVDGRARLFVFAPTDNTYDLNLALALDVEKMGGEVTLVTSRPPRSVPTGLQVWDLPAIPPVAGDHPVAAVYLRICPLERPDSRGFSRLHPNYPFRVRQPGIASIKIRRTGI